MPTCEDRVAEALFNWFKNRRKCQIISYHPPSSKAYRTDLVRIPKRANKVQTRERYHVDVVVTESEYLFLIELKCRLSESDDDIAKLYDIAHSYMLGELLELIKRRATIPIDLTKVRQLVLGLGFENFDQPNAPNDFITFCTKTSPPIVEVGKALPSSLSTLFS
jgi:hypothetical protein